MVEELEQVAVHPGLSWGKLESATLEEGRLLEVLLIAKAANVALVGHDLAVHARKVNKLKRAKLSPQPWTYVKSEA